MLSEGLPANGANILIVPKRKYLPSGGSENANSIIEDLEFPLQYEPIEGNVKFT